MGFSIRRAVTWQGYGEELTGLAGILIELALPYKLHDYLEGTSSLKAMAAFIVKEGPVCPSVHAPQGRLTHDGFLSWALDVVRFAESIGAGVLVFHPENAKEQRTNLQMIALRNLRELQRSTQVRIAVETFGNSKRVLLPEEIGERKLPMVLDTSHVFQERGFYLIERYHATIAAVHLSEMRKDANGEVRPHMPVEGYGFDVLRALEEKGWHGPVTLEYLPDYHHRLLADRQTLESLFPTI